MPRKKKGKHQTRKQIRRGAAGGGPVEKRELIFKEDGQVYALVIKILGSGRFELQCCDGVNRMGILRGALHKRAWVRLNTLVLASMREYQGEKADIFHVYNHEEFRQLTVYKEVPTAWTHASADAPLGEQVKEDDGIDFDEI